MDIHRCRFVPFPPQPISALAFSHSSNTAKATPSDLRLAVGRERSGDVEIWNPFGGKWVQESVLRGRDGRSVEQLAWTQDLEAEEQEDTTTYTSGKLRLFSIGGSTSITEWDLSGGMPKRHAEGNFGDIWCFAAQPPLNTETKQPGVGSSQALVAGCYDGSIVLFSTDGDDLRFSRVLLQKPGKIDKVLSITWRDSNTIVAGYENSTIRIIDVPTRRILRSMTLGKPAQGNKAVVWTVKCLANGTILSGDSSGELKIWDAHTLSLVQRLHTHQADILDVAHTTKGDQLFTVGVDRRTVAYRLITTPGVKTERWTEASHRRFHRNDVKCIATYESGDLSVVVTGGVDAAPVINSIKNGDKSLHQTLPHLPQRPPVSCARRARLFISWWQQSIHIYYVPRRSHSGQSLGLQDYSLLATLRLKGDEHIQAAMISQDGRFVITSSTSGARLFQLRLTNLHGKPVLRSRSVDLPPSLNRFGARHVGISPDTKWIYAIRPDNIIVLCKVIPGATPKDKPTIHTSITKLIPTFTHPSPTLASYPSNVSAATFSHDSRVLAVGTLSGTVTTWVLSGHEDTTPLSPTNPSLRPTDDDSDTSMSDVDSDSDEESETPTVHNQRWVLTPSSTSAPYPSLGSSILLLTFRPPPTSAHSASPSHTNGNIGLHATRHNPHPISHEHPEPAPQLIAISADHKLVEFDVYTGKLTDWSRRNQRLPLKFMTIRDRVKGCFWDTTIEEGRTKQRLWLYGNMFLAMFNISEDIGDDTADTTGEHNDLRRRKTWSTFVYRDILGAGVIGNEDEKESEANGEDIKMNGIDPSSTDGLEKSHLEVVLVERPMWDVQQPPRFDGGQDWET